MPRKMPKLTSLAFGKKKGTFKITESQGGLGGSQLGLGRHSPPGSLSITARRLRGCLFAAQLASHPGCSEFTAQNQPPRGSVRFSRNAVNRELALNG
jgi:hypothetical protein